MPELPDVVVYIEALEARVRGATLERVRVLSPFVLRSVDPPLAAAAGREVRGLRRLGKRIVLELADDLFLVLHLMIAGRLHWKPAGATPPGKIGLAAFDFSAGTLTMTEAGTKRRAALHLVRGEAALREHDPGGLDVLAADAASFRQALECRIAFATKPQDLAVKVLFAGEVPEQQRLGNPRRLGQLFGGGARKPFSGKKRERRRNDRLPPLVAIHSVDSHGPKVSAYLPSRQAVLVRCPNQDNLPVLGANLKTGVFLVDTHKGGSTR